MNSVRERPVLPTIDPLEFAAELWPNVTFYREQEDVIYSVLVNDETFVPAGNKLGKDFTAAFIILYFFLTRHPCRVVTTSAKEDHLRVLWGEMNSFVQTCRAPLEAKDGGPLVVKHQEMKKLYRGRPCPLSYVRGLVASPDSIAAMGGHHIANTGDGVPRTLFVSDESSSVPDEYYFTAIPWANRVLAIGNTWPCSNWFRKAIDGGDLLEPEEEGEVTP